MLSGLYVWCEIYDFSADLSAQLLARKIFEVLPENISPSTLFDENCQFRHYFDVDISIFQISVIFYQSWKMENVLRLQ